MTMHKIIIGDSRNMQELSNSSVRLVITSPPYWQLKDYGTSEQIGFNDRYEDYINNLNLVWKECYRVLHPGCRLCINIGDQFARSVYYGRYKVIPIRTEIIKFCETLGFDYMGAIIWQKVTTCNTTGGATIMGSFPYPRNGIIKIDYEFILLFRKTGKPPDVSRQIKEQSKIDKKEWNEYFSGHWNFSGTRQDKHIAPFPEELPKRLIKMFSFVGDVVLDPFLGSGTTSVAAIRFNRDSVGYEINKDYIETIKKRLKDTMGLFESKVDIEVMKQEHKETNWDLETKELPYVFKDPIIFERKVDPKKLRFGSKIDDKEQKTDRYYTIKKIISPADILLDSGAQLHLLGIKTKAETREHAIKFLEDITKGQRVFLKFDSIKHDGNNNLFAYLYLKNKTFINAHLVKKQLVNVDTSCDYKYKSRFLGYTQIKEK